MSLNLNVETITVEQFDAMMNRLQEDGENPHFFGPCLIINFVHDGAVSVMYCPGESGKGGLDFNYSVSYVSPYTAPLQALLNVVGAENKIDDLNA